MDPCLAKERAIAEPIFFDAPVTSETLLFSMPTS